MNNRKLLEFGAVAILSTTLIPSCTASQEGTKNKPDTQPSTPAATVVASATTAASAPTTAPTATSKPDANPVASAPVATTSTKNEVCLNVTSLQVNPFIPAQFGSRYPFTGTRREGAPQNNSLTLHFNGFTSDQVDGKSPFGTRMPMGFQATVKDVNGVEASVIQTAEGKLSYVDEKGKPAKNFVPPPTESALREANQFSICTDNWRLVDEIEQSKCPPGQVAVYTVAFSVVEASKALNQEAISNLKVNAVFVATGFEYQCLAANAAGRQ